MKRRHGVSGEGGIEPALQRKLDHCLEMEAPWKVFAEIAPCSRSYEAGSWDSISGKVVNAHARCDLSDHF
jgi:hypothetical protein